MPGPGHSTTSNQSMEEGYAELLIHFMLIGFQLIQSRFISQYKLD